MKQSLQWIYDECNALAVALFVPRCGACDEPLAARPRAGLCRACHEMSVLNDGPRCVQCDAPGETPKCRRCAAGERSFVELRAPYIYGGPIADLVQRAKFRGREDLAVAAGDLLVDALAPLSTIDAIVPIPLGWRRRLQRRYNQSTLLASRVAKAWKVPLRQSLRRKRHTQAQSDLSLNAREANVRGAFCAHGKMPQRILLVDDVVTSGHTVEQASRALLQAGAQEVKVIALARAS